MLSLGWPGIGRDLFGAEAPQAASTSLAKRLRDEGPHRRRRPRPERSPRRSFESRDVVIRMTWDGDALLDLAVDEPLGVTTDHFTPRSVFGGSLVKPGRTKDHEAVYVCPRGFDGPYVARVLILFNDQKKPARIAKIEMITHEGTELEKVVKATVSLDKPMPATVVLSEGRRKVALPYVANPEDLMPREEAPSARREPDLPSAWPSS